MDSIQKGNNSGGPGNQVILYTGFFKQGQELIIAVSAEGDEARNLRIDQHFSAQDAG